jgi:hypothetical protein
MSAARLGDRMKAVRISRGYDNSPGKAVSQ